MSFEYNSDRINKLLNSVLSDCDSSDSYHPSSDETSDNEGEPKHSKRLQLSAKADSTAAVSDCDASMQMLEGSEVCGILHADKYDSVPNENISSEFLERESNTPCEVLDILDLDPHFQVTHNQDLQAEVASTPIQVDGIPATEDLKHTEDKRVRKTIPCPPNWKANVRKERYQAGRAYTSRRGKYVPDKKVNNKKDCLNSCKFKCSTKVSASERHALFRSYYSLTQNEKYHFLASSTERSMKNRITKPGEESRRGFSFKYSFNIRNENVRVCKQFYLGTLNISQKPVYNVHKNKDIETGVPKPDQRGLNSSRCLPETMKNEVRMHIESFPAIESHYCRSSTSKKYLSSYLNIKKMYDLYCDLCKSKGSTPVKQSLYRRIFLTEYNLDFYKPKSDRCDVCEAYKVSKGQHITTEAQKTEYEEHFLNKTMSRAERDRDRKNKDIPVLSFDLQNVIACPRAEISSFFYRRKLNTYNLTAVLSTTRQVYCALWTEVQSGRAGNDIASAFRVIVDHVISENNIDELITWSDSCVPQNRNAHISFAVLDFLRENSDVKRITMKYSTPGHSCIQEVDNVHSCIEKAMRVNEFFSPLGLIRILKGINRTRPYKIVQMKDTDFKDFGTPAKLLNYKLIPFTKVSSIIFSQVLHEVQFVLSHSPDSQTQVVSLKMLEKPVRRTTKKVMNAQSPSPGVASILELRPKVFKQTSQVTEEKKKDIKTMLQFMPLQDRAYYNTVLHLQS